MPNPFDEPAPSKKEKIIVKDKSGKVYELMPNPFVDDSECPEPLDEAKPSVPKPKAPKPNPHISRLWKK